MKFGKPGGAGNAVEVDSIGIMAINKQLGLHNAAIQINARIFLGGHDNIKMGKLYEQFIS